MYYAKMKLGERGIVHMIRRGQYSVLLHFQFIADQFQCIAEQFKITAQQFQLIAEQVQIIDEKIQVSNTWLFWAYL